MRILLIRQTSGYSFPMIGFGMGTVATILRDVGHTVKVIDNQSFYTYYSDRRLIKSVKKFHPDVIGFTITIVNVIQTFQTLSKLQKKFRNILYIAGGHHLMRTCFKEALDHGFDIVVNREAEKVVVPLFDHLEGKTRQNFRDNLKTIPGISFIQKDGRIFESKEYPEVSNLDEVPFADYNLFNLNDFFKTKKEPAVVLITGQRGCQFKCKFCSTDYQRADKRLTSAEYMFNYVRYIHEEYGVTYIWIADNNLLIRRDRVTKFCENMIASGLNKKVSLVIQTHVLSPIDGPLLDLMKEAGFIKIGFGLERLEPYSQKMVNKKAPIAKVHEVLSLVRKHGLGISVNMIIGFPFDTVEILRKERELFLSLSKYTPNIIANVLTPLPGTTYYDDHPKVRNWYLNRKSNYSIRSYYSHVFDLAFFDLLDLNLFNLPKEVVEEQKKLFLEFKRYNHGRYGAYTSLVVRFAIWVDKTIANLSKFIYKISPRIEFWLFGKIKFLRYYIAACVFGHKVS